MPALISAAEATKNLRVAANVLNNDLRHPVLVAREAATVDLLTEGRLQLGLGAGHMQSEYEQAGLNFEAGGIRVERLAEAVTLSRVCSTVNKSPSHRNASVAESEGVAPLFFTAPRSLAPAR
jgi:alkanesulfonate monooxygenase SsuD/methylene tetrahydromethanopterin reductase-like flavin-dependent oxidoreductase (luciferase family)